MTKQSPTSGKRQATDFDLYVSMRVRLRRLQMGMSQGDLGEHLGITFQQIQKYENGQNRISAGRLYEIGRALEVPVGYFHEGLPEYTTASDDERDAISHFIASRYGVELAKAYLKIANRDVQKRVLDLARSLSK